ncbi:MAG: dTDP-glucose 4,6-dehydratase [Legionella sp.]|nr:MAG: dTDP-glucose 4,6-dehydratase [Legionella sp.]
MTILVTGGAGFIGSNFIIDWFAKHDEPLINLDILTYAANLKNLESVELDHRYLFIKGDISDQSLFSQILKKYNPRAIVNFAAESHVDRSIHSPEVFVKVNTHGTFCLLECARNYWVNLNKEAQETFRFLHVSTDEVYGSLEPGEGAFTENHPYRPNNPYSASKASADHLVRAYYHTYGLPVLTTHCSNNYGPFQYPEKLMPLIINNALAGKPLPIYGDGQQIRDWLFVGDHCSGIRRVLEAGLPGQVYNIGGFNEKTNLEVVHTICQLLNEIALTYPPLTSKITNGFDQLITYVTDRPGHDRRYAIDSSKITKSLNWKPEETFETGMKKTVMWYVENRQWIHNVTQISNQKWCESQY